MGKFLELGQVLKNLSNIGTSAKKPLMLRDKPLIRIFTKKNRSINQIAKQHMEAIDRVVSGEDPWPLFLHGVAGTGKTCASLCVTDLNIGKSGYFQVSEFCERLILAMKGQLESSSGFEIPVSMVWDDVICNNLAILDEIGTRENVSDFHYETVKKFIDYRDGFPFIAISNSTPEDIAKLYDDRVASRLCSGTVIEFEGMDRRLSN